MIGVLFTSDSCVASTIFAIACPTKGSPPRDRKNITSEVEIRANPIVAPIDHPIPSITPLLKSFIHKYYRN